jgi:hypothetical protein
MAVFPETPGRKLMPLLWLMLLCLPLAFLCGPDSTADKPRAKSAVVLSSEFSDKVRPLLVKYCLACHSTKEKKGELDLQRFTSLAAVRKDVKPWTMLIEQLEAGEMPPKGKPQPTAPERKRLIDWTRRFLNAEARARAGDPGRVPLRRLSNAEYDNTIRDLTGVDLRPAREFPADGAAGEGFTNAAEALRMSPAMMEKYLAASKKIASHAVLLPDGFRFSPKNTRRDWTDESLAKLRAFYHQFTKDGRIPFASYLTALIRHRTELQAGKTTIEAVAKRETLSPKYLRILWEALNGKESSFPLDSIRTRWRTATERDVPAIVAEVDAWREPLWNIVKIGSYRYGNTVRAVAKDPAVAASRSFRLTLKPEPGQRDVILYLVARELGGDGKGTVVWQRPRFEAAGKPPLALRDYDKFGSRYEIDYAVLFGKTGKYLAAARYAAHDRKASLKELAKKHGVDEHWLKRWIEVLALNPSGKADQPGRVVPPIMLTLLDQKVPRVGQRPAINGWIAKGAGLPILVSNSSDKTESIPGRVSPHHVAVHPTPAEFVAAVWKSPVAGKVRIAAKIAHAHNACGNGVGWWIEQQSPKRSAVLAQGTVDRGKSGSAKPFELTISRGDRLFLAIDARDGSHVCDMTEISFTITEAAKPNRKWDLAADVADNLLDGNPHADRLGNKDVWSFVKGPIKERSRKSGAGIPDGSLLARWRKVAVDPAKRADTGKLAMQVQALLVGKRPAKRDDPDRALYDNLVALNGLLLQGIEHRRLSLRERAPRRESRPHYGLPQSKFTNSDLVAPLNNVIELRLPAALFHEHAFVVDGKPTAEAKDGVVQFHVLTSRTGKSGPAFDSRSPIVTTPNGPGHQRLLAGLAEFRRLFPPYICYPHVIPLDEVVCLKTFHREDEPLKRLFLDKKQTTYIDRLWAEHRFITKYPVVENEYLPLFIGFVTQDQPKKLLDYFNSRRGWFRERTERFERDFDAAAPQQMRQLLDFASRAFRRPLRKTEQDNLYALYDALRKKKMPRAEATRTLPASGSLDRMSHEDAFRNVLARVLVSPSFLLHLEVPPPGKKPRPVSDWELASRLSYFLWGSIPDDELRRAATTVKLHDPKELERQTRRMLKDDRVRGLAIEFGTQWIHVRNFDAFNEKNETLFTAFAELRKAMYEESVLFFQDLFQHNRPITDILNSDATYLNETLAKHYGIPGVTGPQFRRVTGVRKYGRGGILGLASVQAKQAGASRTSPVLRGNWVVETLLGEKLPRPPKNVPQLPEKETGNAGLTMRELVEKHTRVASCAACHQRIDPFGFAFERFDPIGRRRDKDLGGLPVDTHVTLRDGTKFTGLGGLRNYLLTKKRDVVLRLFCRRLLGYALCRSVTLSDEPLLDEIMARMKTGEGRLVDVVLAIVKSPQFRMIRGSEFAAETPRTTGK